MLAHPDGSIEVLTDPLDYETVRARLMADGFAPASGEITQRASTHTPLDGEQAVSMVQLFEQPRRPRRRTEHLPNAEIPDEVLARLTRWPTPPAWRRAGPRAVLP